MVEVEVTKLEKIRDKALRIYLVVERELLSMVEERHRAGVEKLLKEFYESVSELEALINAVTGAKSFDASKIAWRDKNDFQWAKDDGSDEFAKMFNVIKTLGGKYESEGYRYWIISSTNRVVGRKKI